jgi:hypothetical protein
MIPPESTVSSFFLHGGNLELSLAAAQRTIVAHTNRHAVYEFWHVLKQDKEGVVAAVNEFYPKIDSLLFYFLQQAWAEVGDPVTRSAFFFILNRCSEQGTISSGKIDKNNFNPMALSYLRNFDGTNVYPLWDDLENPIEAIESAKETDYMLFPAGKFSFNLFEHGKSRGYDTTSFNHRALHQAISETQKKAIVIYKTHPQLFNLYHDHNIRMVDKYGRITLDRDVCEELVIANF